MKRITLLLLCVVAILLTVGVQALQTNPALLAACYVRIDAALSSDDEKIKTVLRAFFTAMEKQDIAAARKFATKSSEQVLSLLEQALKMQEPSPKKGSQSTFKVKNLKIGRVIIKDDQARVLVTGEDTTDNIWFTLKQEEGEWKVAFDKSFMTENSKPAPSELKPKKM